MQELKNGILCVLNPFLWSPVLLHLSAMHLSAIFYPSTAFSVCELEEIFLILELHTCMFNFLSFQIAKFFAAVLVLMCTFNKKKVNKTF